MKTRRSDFAAVILFVLFICAPLSALVIIGPVAAYGGKGFEPLEMKSNLLADNPGKRDALVQSILDRSWVRKTSLRVYNWVAYSVFRSVDTSQMISGKDGWLFFKEQFTPCIGDDVWNDFYESIAINNVFAKSVDIELILSISPNKSSLYPEMLQSKYRLLTECAEENARRWRELAQHADYMILDHLPSLEALKQKFEIEGQSQPIYFETDTHWRSWAAPAVVADLLQRSGADPATAPQAMLAVGSARTPTDLYNLMLLQEGLSTQPADLPVPLEPEPQPEMIIVHDSFYERFASVLEEAFNVAGMYHIFRDRDILADRLRNYHGRLVVNSVERGMLGRFGHLNTSSLTEMLKPRLDEVANSCESQAILPEQVTIVGATVDEDFQHFEPTGNDPMLILELGDDETGCLKLQVMVEQPSTLKIYLPPLAGKDQELQYTESRSMLYPLASGANEIALVIPPELAGTWRIDPVDQQIPFALGLFETGTLQPPVQ